MSKVYLVLIGLAALVSTVPATFAQSSAPAASLPSSQETSGALRIHVIAVQGGAQFRDAASPRWRSLAVNTDLPEGAEIRTGPKGAVQFTIGTDQVFRVDRLSVVKILRASLMPDGTIRTDVGLSYGRVSKDVDSPERPHEDTIVSPSSTLAVRGTRVSLYDQPPYAPEAVSLTGAAVFTNVKHLAVAFGSHGGGKNKVVGNDDSAADSAFQATAVDPISNFSGRSATEQEFQLVLQAAGVSSLQDLQGLLGQFFKRPRGGFAVPPTIGQLSFRLFWMGTPASLVNLSITDPLGEVLSAANLNTPSSGFLQAESPAGPNGIGQATGGFSISFPIGQYTFNENLAAGSNATATLLVIENPLTTGVTLGQFQDNLTTASPAAAHQLNVAAPPPAAAPSAVRAAAFRGK